MKKMIYTLGLIGLISGVANAADDYTCATPPSCASLGYTLTSTTDCIGTPLKCPFDASKYYCVTQDDIVPKWASYDYANSWNDANKGKHIVTMAKAGCILGIVGGKADRYYIRVNQTSGNPSYDGNFYDMPISYNGGGQFFFCLKKGDKFMLANNGNEEPRDYRYRIMYFK